MASELYDKKLDFSFESKNFAIEGELTVTITLSEYRDLVASKATKEEAISKANEDKYNREHQIKHLEEENSKLKSELYELQKRLNDLDADKVSSADPDDGGEY